jgi:hypothetical protein
MPRFVPNLRIAALHNKHERCHIGASIDAYSVGIDNLRPLNFTLGVRRRLNFLAALVRAIGRAFDQWRASINRDPHSGIHCKSAIYQAHLMCERMHIVDRKLICHHGVTDYPVSRH